MQGINIFFLCLSVIISVVHGGDPSPGDATDETVQQLDKINVKQALPVIAFEVKKIIKYSDQKRYHFVDKKVEQNLTSVFYRVTEFETLVGLTKAVVKDGRLVSGTEFYSKSSGTQIFFCPTPQAQSSELCLAPKEFKNSEPLQCDDEPIPRIYIKRISTSFVGTSIIHFVFSYEFCPSVERYMDAFPSYYIYKLCYDVNSKKMISASYDLAAILEDELFTREREISFVMSTETHEFINANYYSNLLAEIEQKPKYEVKKLVPIEDMPLATSRRSTEYVVNFVLQHKSLTEVWDEIGRYFRDHARRWPIHTYTRSTGVFDIPKDEITISVGENQQANIWITILVDFSAKPGRGLAVLMNNFIMNDDPYNKDADTETSKKQYIDTLCGRDNDNCVDSLKDRFNAFDVEGRCCKVTRDIYQLFLQDEKFNPFDILDVKNINFSD